MAAHGYGPYTRGCRCEVCRNAKADYMRARRAAGRAKAAEYTVTASGARGSRSNIRAAGSVRFMASNVTHGTRYAYEEHGCRCFDCTDARTVMDRKYRSAS